MIDSPLCLAIDTPDRSSIEKLVDATKDVIGIYKVGLTTIYGVGVDAIQDIDWAGRPLFLDAKLHDIPAQIEGAVDAMRGLGVSYVTVHASGGEEMLRAAVKAAGDGMQILAVTILTSLQTDDLAAMGSNRTPGDLVMRLGQLAIEAGVFGLVCSPLEVGALRARFGPRAEGGPLLVTPGIRPAGSDPGDQRRTLGPREAIEAGADVLVVGRPITHAPDTGAAARAIFEEVSV
jgi:orotidine-5'-phosphate decarboxylase